MTASRKPRTQRHRKHDRLTNPDASAIKGQIRCDLLVASLDREQQAMDLKWGIDRLPGLVPVERDPKYADAVSRFGEIYEDLNRAIDANDPLVVQQLVPRVVKGLQVLDGICEREEIEKSNPRIIEQEIDGWHIGIIGRTEDWKAAKAARPDLEIFTLREAVVGLKWLHERDHVAEARKAFPGVEVRSVKAKTYDDPIPF